METKSKILLLGGSAAQLVAIRKAKELGYYTIVCDYLMDNPGQHIADRYYNVSTTDITKILKIASEENIDGIVAYSSDPAAPTAAYVAQKLNLPGLDYEKVRHFCEKQLFRKFLKNNGFNVPRSLEIKIPLQIESLNSNALKYPVIIKPTDSSGSKGVSVLQDTTNLKKALEEAAKFSRNKTLIIEEFIERDHPHVIEAEIFTINGKVVSWGLINSIRDCESNPLLPAGYSYPLELSNERIKLVKSEISRLIHAFGNPSGAFNIEMIIDKNNQLYFLDAGPRNGGNMLPEFISMISGKDLVEATIRNAMGEIGGLDVELDSKSGEYWGLAVLHTNQHGKFKTVNYNPIAKKALVREEIQKSPGEEVTPFIKCNDLIGLSFFHFREQLEMENVMGNMNNSIIISTT